MAKKIVPNPAYDEARYVLKFVDASGVADVLIFEFRTNNRNYILDGMKLEDVIPPHIEVED